MSIQRILWIKPAKSIIWKINRCKNHGHKNKKNPIDKKNDINHQKLLRNWKLNSLSIIPTG